MTSLYLFSLWDNGSFMLKGDAPHPACPQCGFVVNQDWIDPDFKLVRRGLDVSATYDGYTIVSQKFRDIVGEEGLTYNDLPEAAGFYHMRVLHQVEFDSEKRKTRFFGRCGKCKRFRSVVGATPVFLRNRPDGVGALYRTDLEFGTGDAKSPLVLASDWIARRLEDSALQGLDLVPVQ